MPMTRIQLPAVRACALLTPWLHLGSLPVVGQFHLSNCTFDPTRDAPSRISAMPPRPPTTHPRIQTHWFLSAELAHSQSILYRLLRTPTLA